MTFHFIDEISSNKSIQFYTLKVKPLLRQVLTVIKLKLVKIKYDLGLLYFIEKVGCQTIICSPETD
jgi:hypothetical protein